ncbi:MAG TPA: hypothetical protein VGU74_07350 [Gemmatimonadales bacterium]|nr:hypothetical protein [Gemmatimonadales bacterium]
MEAAATGGSHGLLPCRPLPYDSTTVRVGPGGGTIRVGKYGLVIPPHALSRPIDITAVAPTDSVNRVELRPEGLTFDTPVALTMSYQNCAQYDVTKGIAYTTDGLLILSYVPSRDDVWGKKVTGRLSHFSSYAVSW